MSAPINQSPDRSIGYTVHDIATPTSELTVWESGTSPEDSLKKAQQRQLTIIPVREGSRITGFVRTTDLAVGRADVSSLTVSWLVTADTPILAFTDILAANPTYIYFVMQASHVTGIVAAADLNKVPARASFYLIVAHFEAELTLLLRQRVGSDYAALKHFLSDGRVDKAQGIQQEDRERDID
ncbi:MAG: hypothetical protein AAF125_25655, partial [Chloroflexota bacterium]